jgi:hypothetical protein
VAVGIEEKEEHWGRAVAGPGSGRKEAMGIVPVQVEVPFQAEVVAAKDGGCWPLAEEAARCGLREVAREW